MSDVVARCPMCHSPLEESVWFDWSWFCDSCGWEADQ